jgi:PAS domain S-box-containing protein
MVSHNSDSPFIQVKFDFSRSYRQKITCAEDAWMSEVSGEGLHCLVENAAVAIATTNLKGRFTYINQALADLLGYSKQELMGYAFKEFLHPDEKGRVTRLFLKSILLRRDLRNFEFRAMHKDGHVLYLMSKPTRFVVNNKTVGFQAVIVDVSERKEIERNLLQTNKKLEMLFETAMEGISIVDEKENITFVNKAFADMLGYKEEYLIGSNLRKLVDEKNFKEIERQTEARKKGIISRYELIMHRKNGKPCIVQVSASPLCNETGSFAGTMAIVMDITERKKTEKALLENQQRFERLFKSNPDASVYADVNDRFLDANSRFVELFGYDLEEAKGKALDNLIVPKNKREEAKDLTKKSTEGYVYYETVRRRKDGSVFPVSISAAPIYVDHRYAGCVISYRDISDRVHMQKKLEE